MLLSLTLVLVLALAGILLAFQVPAPALPPTNVHLTSDAALSSSTAVAVGYQVNPYGWDTAAAELYAHGKWKFGLAASNSSDHGTALDGVTALSGGRAWAVGYRTSTGGLARTLTELWDGHSWSVWPSTNPAARGDTLQSVLVVPDGAVYAAGFSLGSAGYSEPLVERFSGSRWVQVASPSLPPGARGGQILSLTSYGGHVFAAGYMLDRNGNQSPLAYQLSGRLQGGHPLSWRSLSVPVKPGGKGEVLTSARGVGDAL